MTLTREALTDVAAIAAAAPHTQVRLGTSHGAAVVIGEHPAGSMCIHTSPAGRSTSPGR